MVSHRLFMGIPECLEIGQDHFLSAYFIFSIKNHVLNISQSVNFAGFIASLSNFLLMEWV
jgi:hypothetical protein